MFLFAINKTLEKLLREKKEKGKSQTVRVEKRRELLVLLSQRSSNLHEIQ